LWLLCGGKEGGREGGTFDANHVHRTLEFRDQEDVVDGVLRGGGKGGREGGRVGEVGQRLTGGRKGVKKGGREGGSVLTASGKAMLKLRPTLACQAQLSSILALRPAKA